MRASPNEENGPDQWSALRTSTASTLRSQRTFPQLRCATFAVAGGAWAWGTGTPAEPGVCFVRKGVANLENTAFVASGGAFVLPAADRLAVTWSQNSGAAVVWLGEEFREQNRFLESALPRVLQRSSVSAAAGAAVSQIAHAREHGDGRENAALERLLGDCLLAMVRTSLQETDEGEREALSLDHVRSHLQEGSVDPRFSVALAAEQLGVTTRQIQRIFEPTGHTPNEYLRSVRLERAQVLLETRRGTGLNLSEIATMSGFPSLPAFRRARRTVEQTAESRTLRTP